MVNIKLLEHETLQNIYPVFKVSYQDTILHTNLSESEFVAFVESCDYRPDLSVGIYDSEQLVAFCLIGFRIEENRRFAYNIFTGVIPNQRRKGLANTMFKAVEEVLRRYNFDAYLLEVTKDNSKAKRLVEKHGFKTYRSFYTMSKATARGVLDPLQRCGIAEVDINHYWDFTPSWKNMTSEALIKDEDYKWVVEGSIDEPLAYALFNDKTGIVLQFAIHYDARRQGHGSKLLKVLEDSNYSSYLIFTNIPTTSYFKEFLQNNGYADNIESIEYVLTLKQ